MKNTSTDNNNARQSRQPTGFAYEGKTIYFVEAKGKDISYARWRADLYYKGHMASTAFFQTEATYNNFLAEAAKHTFEEYSDFRKAWDNGSLSEMPA